MFAQRDVFREVKGVWPVDDLAVRVVGIFGTEGRPAHKAFEHDCAGGPPVAGEGIALAAEDLGCDIVGSPNGRIGHNAARFTPGVDLGAVANGKVDLVEGYRVAIARLI